MPTGAARTVLVGAAFVAACVGGDADRLGAPWSGDSTVIGDTVVVRTVKGSVRGDLGRIGGEMTTVVYDGETLDRNSFVAVSPGDTAYVAAATSLVRWIGGHVDTIGTEGDGPGEFRRIRGLVLHAGELTVFDVGTMRRTRYVGVPSLLSTAPLVPRSRRGELTQGPIGECREGMSSLWAGGIVVRGGPRDTVDLVFDSGGGSEKVWSFAVTGWTATGIPGPREPFGPKALVAADDACHIVMTDGVGYKLTYHDLAAPTVRRIEVDERPVPLGPEARSIPDSFATEFPSQLLPVFKSLLEAQEFPATRNALEEVGIDAAGRVWVRVVDSTYRYHPVIMTRASRARPVSYRWDIFAPDGRRLATVGLPSGFRPRSWSKGWIYGLEESEDGAFRVVRLPIPKLLSE